MVLAWGALATMVWIVVHSGDMFGTRWAPLAATGAAWVAFALAAVCLLRFLPVRAAIPLVIVGGIALQAIALSTPPQTSDDMYRYMWDGRVQADGIDPYRHVPTAPELKHLRDPWLWPSDQECRAVGEQPGCTPINRENVPTIYPPVAQLYFLGLHVLAPEDSRHKTAQVGGALVAVLTTLALVMVLRRTGGDPRLAVLWAWAPTVPVEAGNNGHVDVLAALLIVLGLGALALRRAGLGGALVGAAVAVKLLPALVMPACLRRKPVTVVVAAAAVFFVSYLPHVFAVGIDVLGYLPSYLDEEGYSGEGRFGVLRIVFSAEDAPVAAVAVLAVTALWVMWHADADRPWRGALVMTGVAFAVVTPTYPWYALLLIGLVALDGRWEWLGLAIAPFVMYTAIGLGFDGEPVQRTAYGSAVALIVLVSVARLLLSRRAGNGDNAPPTVYGSTLAHGGG